MKHPDAFEQMVENERLAATIGISQTSVLRCDDAITLLRAYHRRVVRMVQNEKVDAESTGEESDRAYNSACDDILAALNRMQKGKP